METLNSVLFTTIEGFHHAWLTTIFGYNEIILEKIRSVAYCVDLWGLPICDF